MFKSAISGLIRILKFVKYNFLVKIAQLNSVIVYGYKVWEIPIGYLNIH